MATTERDVESLVRAVEQSLADAPDEWKVTPNAYGQMVPCPMYGNVAWTLIPPVPRSLLNTKHRVAIHFSDPARLTVDDVDMNVPNPDALHDLAVSWLAQRAALALLTPPPTPKTEHVVKWDDGAKSDMTLRITHVDGISSKGGMAFFRKVDDAQARIAEHRKKAEESARKLRERENPPPESGAE